MPGDGATIEIGVTKAITAPFKLLSFFLLAAFIALVVRLGVDMWVLADAQPGEYLEPPSVTLARELDRATAAPDFLGSTRERGERWAAWVEEWGYRKPGLLRHRADSAGPGDVEHAVSRGLGAMDHAISRALAGSQVIAVRLAIVASFLPWAGFLYSVAVVDGLVERSRRKFGGGRESSTLYHRAKYFQVTFFTIALAAYLWWPNAVEPTAIIATSTAMCAYLARLQAKYYKKYI